MKKYYFLFGEGSKVNQVICAILINLPVFAYGASIGWMSPMTLILQSENSPAGKPLTDEVVSWMGAIPYLICIPSDFLAAIVGDRFGRKYTTLLLSVMSAACWTIKLLSMQGWAFILARAMIGMLMAGSYVTCPLYTKEISENSIRGMLGSLTVLGQTSGNLFLYVIGDMLSYHTVLWVCLSLPLIHLVLFTMMPESPSYLVKRGELEKAAKAIAWLRCRKEDDAAVFIELDQIKKEQLKDEAAPKFALKAIITNKLMFRAFKIALAVAIAREFCGAIPVLNFAGEIFTLSSEGTGLVLTPNQQAMLLGAVQVVGSALTFGIVEKSGRKMLLLLSSLISGLAMYRGTVLATAMTLASLSASLQMLFFKTIVKYGPYFAFYCFGGICLAMTLYTILVVPETKMRQLEEIYDDLKTKKEKRLETEMFVIEKKESIA